ncbi:hypothetical protein QFC22_003317 [Naganishia vaughanmartiniae]|uniref:Uncharacterized protein n=1 Tax=Naganishia vaughanmartiniae TaxID=1424756 RepID=A0ACC2X744_9TREE|nr:hypothetical protein QFC22_003317 [Naganishia vaughanmartiniae]
MFLPPHQPILRLPDGLPELIQATTALPTYSAFLAQVVHNAVDANASHISCWINPTCWSIRVTDDGQGISKDELKGGLGCEFGTSSKYRAARRGDAADDGGFLGSRGRALASMGTLAALEIISRRQGFTTTYHKSIKASVSHCLRLTHKTRPSTISVLLIRMEKSCPLRDPTSTRNLARGQPLS